MCLQASKRNARLWFFSTIEQSLLHSTREPGPHRHIAQASPPRSAAEHSIQLDTLAHDMSECLNFREAILAEPAQKAHFMHRHSPPRDRYAPIWLLAIQKRTCKGKAQALLPLALRASGLPGTVARRARVMPRVHLPASVLT